MNRFRRRLLLHAYATPALTGGASHALEKLRRKLVYIRNLEIKHFGVHRLKPVQRVENVQSTAGRLLLLLSACSTAAAPLAGNPA
jgi:hypothetical protein